MKGDNLIKWMKDPKLLGSESLYEIRNQLARYPYSQTLRILLLKNLYLLHDISFGEELRKAALFISDRRLLFSFLERENYTLEVLKKEEEHDDGEESLDRTLCLIDAFLKEYPAEEQKVEVDFDYASDYTSYLSQNEPDFELSETPKLKGHELIDEFIESDAATLLGVNEGIPEVGNTVEEETKPEEVSEPVVLEDEEDDSFFTETLAKIYVKQQRYEKALLIIKKLSLKYPNKNAYFADQIRFLEKLIINSKSK